MTLLVGTRKGLFSLERGRTGWEIDSTEFLGEPVTAAVVAPDGATYAALGTTQVSVSAHRSCVALCADTENR